MIDLKFLRENPEVVKENIKKKFQDHKLPLVDEVIELDAKSRAAQQEADELRASKNKLSKEIGALMAQGKKDEAEKIKKQVAADAARLAELEEQEKELSEKVTKIMMTIPNIIDPSAISCKNWLYSSSTISYTIILLMFILLLAQPYIVHSNLFSSLIMESKDNANFQIQFLLSHLDHNQDILYDHS